MSGCGVQGLLVCDIIFNSDTWDEGGEAVSWVKAAHCQFLCHVLYDFNALTKS